MTPRQISRKLEDAKFNMTHLVQVGRDTLEVLVTDSDGDVKPDATRRAMRKAQKTLGVNWGWFSTGYGGLVARDGFRPSRGWNVR